MTAVLVVALVIAVLYIDTLQVRCNRANKGLLIFKLKIQQLKDRGTISDGDEAEIASELRKEGVIE